MVKMNEYTKRRQKVMQQIGSNGIAIISSAKETTRNGDATYSYRPNSDFYYLTGFAEPDAILILLPKRKEGEYLLFNRSRNPEREIWDGPRAGQAGAQRDFLADQAFPIEDFALMLPDLLLGKEKIHYSLGIYPDIDKILMTALNKIRGGIRSGFTPPIGMTDIGSYLHEMRLFKSRAEIEVMQTAIDITRDAHIRAMEVCQPGMYEFQLEAELMYQFQYHGARYPAYNPIVGAGKNSCILHYVNNQERIKESDVVLIDAGAEYQYYAADITRTFPASGRFSPEQREIYELVLEAQLAAIKTFKPNSNWNKAQEVIVKVITQGLLDLGILKGKLSELIENQAYFPFYMHRSGHWLGLDVHDVGTYNVDGKWRKLEPGMVFTIEPGIYISDNIPGVAKRWHNIGVRIEDNILMTEDGCEVLSQAIPKKIADIESIMA